MSHSRYAAKWIGTNSALAAQEERREEERDREEDRLNSVGLSKLPRPNCVTMLDMAYLSGKIYEDPDADPLYTCVLPDGKSLFDDCSLMLKRWEQVYKVHNSISYETPQDKIEEIKQAIRTYANKYIAGFLLPAFAGSVPISPVLKDTITNPTNEIEKISEITESIIINNIPTYFKAAFYVNRTHRCSVMVIRGTVPLEFMTLIADLGYGRNVGFVISHMYRQAIKFYREAYRPYLKIFRENPLVACTGHSLGGIIAKMIAPVTGLSTYTFNSPGVKQYLSENRLHMGLHANQEIITFYARGDIIGNFRRDNDLGRHIPLSVKGYSKDIEYTSLSKILTEKGLKYSFETRTSYHDMKSMFQHLNETEEGRKYVTKIIKYSN
jgi:hypothetical protein